MQKNISNAFENVPFGDLKYGLLGFVPAEMLHVSGTGLLKHMFGCLDNLIGLFVQISHRHYKSPTARGGISPPLHPWNTLIKKANKYQHHNLKIILGKSQ
jgi:hypothetical protein